MNDRRLFTKDRFYQIGLGILAFVALGIFIAKYLSEQELQERADAQAKEHAAAITELESAHDEALKSIEKQSLGIVVTALGGLPSPPAEGGATIYHPTLDALVTNDHVSLAIVALPDGSVLASSNRHFEGKPLAKAFPKGAPAASPTGLVPSESGWTLAAPLSGGGAHIYLVYERANPR